MAGIHIQVILAKCIFVSRSGAVPGSSHSTETKERLKRWRSGKHSELWVDAIKINKKHSKNAPKKKKAKKNVPSGSQDPDKLSPQLKSNIFRCKNSWTMVNALVRPVLSLLMVWIRFPRKLNRPCMTNFQLHPE